jgi:hypothetical protein
VRAGGIASHYQELDVVPDEMISSVEGIPLYRLRRLGAVRKAGSVAEIEKRLTRETLVQSA